MSYRIKWLMTLRTVIISFILLFTILMNLRGGRGLLPLQLNGLYALCGVAYILTFIYAGLYRFLKDKPAFGYVQVMADNLLVSLIVIITGGVGSLFSVLYFLTIISASIMFYRRGGLLVTLQGGAFYMISIFLPFFFPNSAWLDLEGRYISLPFSYVLYRGIVHLAAFFAVSFLGSYLSESLRKAGEALEAREIDLAELQKLNENILQSISSGLITTDMEGRIISFNRAAETIIGCRAADCRGQRLLDLVDLRSDWDPYRHPWQEADDNRRFEGSLMDQSPTILGMTFSPLRDESGDIKGLICSFQDLTEIKKMEEQIKRSDRLAAIGELAAGVAHEIRNPLASISGSIQVMREDDLPLEDHNLELMDIVTREAEMLNDIISDFLSFANPKPLHLESTSLGGLLEETITLVRRSLDEQEKRYIFTIEDEMGHETIFIDPQLIKQVFWNLSLNAIQAMPEGGRLTVRLKGEPWMGGAGEEPGGDRVVIEFEDTGCGIDNQEMEKIFTPFYSTKENGTGLGLSIVFKVVEQHQGSMEIESRKGEGTVFRLRFPSNLSMVAVGREGE